MANVTNESFKNKTDGFSNELNTKAPMDESALESVAHTAGRRLGAMASDFATGANNYARSGRDYVKANPVKGIALAAAAGALAGSLFSLTLRKRK
jgi:ElaB/YqjD/DUF883 family membrane-anchored ribosome-binding protein